MRKLFRIRALIPLTLLILMSGISGSALRAEDPPPTPQAAPQHVTVPSLPGEPNREGVVKPGGGLKTDQYGNLTQSIGPPPASTAPTTPGAAARPSGRTASPSGSATVPAATAGPAPSGPAVATGANVAHIRGVVKDYAAGKSLTITVRGTGKDVTYTLKAGATVPAGLKAGDPVRIRVLIAEKGKVADVVEVLSKP
jgi:hypothetical protein